MKKFNLTWLEKLNIFGSIRSKYILTFALLISIGFIILALVVSSLITTHSIETKLSTMDDCAKTVNSALGAILDTTDREYQDAVNFYGDYLSGVLINLSSMNDTTIMLTDNSGNILLSSETANSTIINLSRIPQPSFSALVQSTDTEKYSNLSGVFDQRYINYSMPLYSDGTSLDGLIVVSAPLGGVYALMKDITNSLLISAVWIIFAAVIVAVFISERITAPLKNMKKAAKSFSKGNFDIEIPVTGVDSEIADLAGAFNSMAKSINEHEMQRRRFLGNVSHDMRTPMTSIAGFVDGILDGTIPPEKHEYYLKIVSAETHRLSRLVNSLLDITRIQSGERKFNMAEFDICELLRLVLISMEAQIDRKKLQIEFDACDEKCVVFADSDGIHQVAYNILHNAIKFTDDGGEIKIRVEKYDNKKYLVRIYNTGKGMKKEDLPYVFDRFYKTDPSRGLDKSGVGLGLFIVKTIINSHGQDVWVESEEGKYCEFKFTLKAWNDKK